MSFQGSVALLYIPLGDVDVWEARWATNEIDFARDPVKVNVLDDVNKFFHWSVAVEVLEVSFILSEQLVQSQSVEPDSIVDIAAR